MNAAMERVLDRYDRPIDFLGSESLKHQLECGAGNGIDVASKELLGR